jgi:hypothetical protein
MIEPASGGAAVPATRPGNPAGASPGSTGAAFLKKWHTGCPGAAKSLEEAGAELLTFFRYPRSQWKSWRTTNSIGAFISSSGVG